MVMCVVKADGCTRCDTIVCGYTTLDTEMLLCVVDLISEAYSRYYDRSVALLSRGTRAQNQTVLFSPTLGFDPIDSHFFWNTLGVSRIPKHLCLNSHCISQSSHNEPHKKRNLAYVAFATSGMGTQGMLTARVRCEIRKTV